MVVCAFSLTSYTGNGRTRPSPTSPLSTVCSRNTPPRIASLHSPLTFVGRQSTAQGFSSVRRPFLPRRQVLFRPQPRRHLRPRDGSSTGVRRNSLVLSTAPPRIIISGAPASGKGTQCEFIVKEFGVVHISTGDMLRAAVKDGTPVGREAQSYMDAGNLVPDELVISLLKERILQDDCRQNGWLLDGFPRTAAQAQALDDAGVAPLVVVSLDVDDAVLIKRVIGRRLDPDTGAIYHLDFNPPPSDPPEILQRLVQRSDDTEEKARVRLATFHDNAKAIETHYSSILRHVDGGRSKDRVFEDVKAVIEQRIYSSDDGTENSGVADDAVSSSEVPFAEQWSFTPSSKDTLVKTSEDKPTSPGSREFGSSIAEFVQKAEEAYEEGRLATENVNWSGQAGVDSPLNDGTSSHGDILRRLDVALGDLVAYVLFAWIGRASHGNAALSGSVFTTALPFVCAWFLCAPLLGAYRRSATENFKTVFRSLLLPWLAASTAGVFLRAIVTHHSPPPPFVVVSFISTFVLLSGWRALYVAVRGPETSVYRRGSFFDGLEMISTLFRRW